MGNFSILRKLQNFNISGEIFVLTFSNHTESQKEISNHPSQICIRINSKPDFKNGMPNWKQT